MILWPFFFFSLLFADELSIEKYCFSSSTRMEEATKQLTSITVPSDQLERNDQCLTVTMKPHRRELIQSFLRSKDRDLSITFSSVETTRDPCKLKIERIAAQEKQQEDLTLDYRSGAQLTQTKSSGNETIHIQTIKSFEFVSNQETIKGECRFIVPTRYEITLRIDNLLQTQLHLVPGEKIEVGSVIRTLREKKLQADTLPSVSINSSAENKIERIYLSIDNN